MKRLLLFLALLAPFAGSASSPDSARHNPWSFGVILLNYSYFPKGDPDMHLFPGLVIRRDFGSFRLRSSFEASYRSLGMNGVPYPDEAYTSMKEWEGTIRTGIEKGWVLRGVFRPYIGLDVSASYFKSDFSEVGGFAGVIEERIAERKVAGLLPVAGVEFLLTNHFSLSLEAQAAFVYGETKSQTIYYLGNVDSRPQREKGFYAYLAPPGNMSLHFRF